jgi:hypothetical protein
MEELKDDDKVKDLREVLARLKFLDQKINNI